MTKNGKKKKATKRLPKVTETEKSDLSPFASPLLWHGDVVIAGQKIQHFSNMPSVK